MAAATEAGSTGAVGMVGSKVAVARTVAGRVEVVTVVAEEGARVVDVAASVVLVEALAAGV